jgi:catechol-2,3-dioxygenase
VLGDSNSSPTASWMSTVTYQPHFASTDWSILTRRQHQHDHVKVVPVVTVSTRRSS